ncbi:hypothetical protein AJ85_12985 [Alkalihalobacillus alcalophilus ATCC 27647 = CGMCC 1.3604]|uniref:Uncharacterized protein n=1 Tax=Alkalihalobacillus alcalophilus ATCC 27647 = CGMCC 1.3604 TaxID=1218173 RepID=A0A4S4K3R6_ALKAL|nr:hypothetical protein AJ85_12985 [Alkalihalobacillus alcalophilus ATCC 27647 = CGMCC 1.3604]
MRKNKNIKDLEHHAAHLIKSTADPQNPTEYKGLGHSPNFPRSL